MTEQANAPEAGGVMWSGAPFIADRSLHELALVAANAMREQWRVQLAPVPEEVARSIVATYMAVWDQMVGALPSQAKDASVPQCCRDLEARIVRRLGAEVDDAIRRSDESLLNRIKDAGVR